MVWFGLVWFGLVWFGLVWHPARGPTASSSVPGSTSLPWQLPAHGACPCRDKLPLGLVCSGNRTSDLPIALQLSTGPTVPWEGEAGGGGGGWGNWEEGEEEEETEDNNDEERGRGAGGGGEEEEEEEEEDDNDDDDDEDDDEEGMWRAWRGGGEMGCGGVCVCLVRVVRCVQYAVLCVRHAVRGAAPQPPPPPPPPHTHTWFSMLARTEGSTRSPSMRVSACTRAIPSGAGCISRVSASRVTYCRFTTFATCVAMEASVPMPCCSMSPSSSDSVRWRGGWVWPRSKYTCEAWDGVQGNGALLPPTVLRSP